MRLADLFSACDEHFVLLTRAGERLHVTQVFPDRGPLPEDLVAALRQNKPAILGILRWEEEADRLLLESTRRLAAAWPAGCDLGTEWEDFENATDRAYAAADFAALFDSLEARESYALDIFENYRRTA